MLGETLEQHCEAEFNKLRATGFQNAYFEKDNPLVADKDYDIIKNQILDLESKYKYLNHKASPNQKVGY